jgi:hypothetical protein
MKLVCKIACVALLMNTLPAISQERVFYKTVQVNGLNIFYREAGPANAPVILLLHGVPTSSRMYQAMLESSLNANCRLIAPDYPGFGHSSWPNPKEFSYTFDHLARVTEDFANALELGRYPFLIEDLTGIQGLNVKYPLNFRSPAVQALGECGSQARPAVPALLECLKTVSSYMHEAIAKSLKAIDPAVAAKAEAK